MKRQNYFFLLAASLLLGATLGSCSSDDADEKPIIELGNVTSEMVRLGNPLSEKYKEGTPRVYARNVWDMHAFNNKIYFGGGNSSNYAPAPNAGSADLWSYDLASGDFIKEYTTGDEQIHIIREFDRQLYIPGHDSRISGWERGNYYRLESGVWKMYHIANAIHVYDIYKWQGKLFLSKSSYEAENSIFISFDDGSTWHETFCTRINSKGEEVNYPYMGRLYNMFPLEDKLYASAILHYSGKENVFTVHSAQGTTPLFTGIKGANRMERHVVFQNRTVYIVAKTDNDHQYLPLALAAATDWQTATRFTLPEEGMLPRDILVKEGRLMVLVSKQNPDKTYTNTVLVTSDIASETMAWSELFHFTAGTFARSFEYLDGTFYFGLGCETDVLAPETGDILSFAYTR